jgi:response regulator RpfG family c-di-GMP phosphodiesterase
MPPSATLPGGRGTETMAEVNLRRVLVVDDEPHVVSAVQRELNGPPFEFYDYVVEGFSVPEAALRRAGEVDFDAVISDYRMPGMDGIAFLGELARLRPDCMRLVLSGQTDMDTLTRLVNESRIYRFIPKPWSAHALKAALAQALDYGAVLRENRRLAELARQDQAALSSDADDAIAQILVVDDDMAVLNSLARSLRQHAQLDELVAAIRGEAGHHGASASAGRFAIQATPSTAHALRLAESVDFACVVADFRMPEMDGVEFLKRFARVQPDCSRILVSGEIGKDDLARAVNQAHIFAFLDKPWSDFELRTSVLLGVARQRLLRENRVLAARVG